MNPCGGTSKSGREKSEGALEMLKTGAGIGSMASGKPKLKDVTGEEKAAMMGLGWF